MRAKGSFSVESARTKFRERLERGSARSAMHSTRECSVSVLPTSSACLIGPGKSDWRIPNTTRESLRNGSSLKKRHVLDVGLQPPDRNILLNLIPAPVAL